MVDIKGLVTPGKPSIAPTQSTLKVTGRHIVYDIETTGLEPFTDRILCISIMEVHTLEIKSFCQEDEQQLLKDFFEEVQNVTKFIGYNSQSFDAPFILQRCMFYGIKLTKEFLDIKNQVDLRKHSLGFFLSYNKFAKGRLCQWAEKFGDKVETPNGSMMPKLFLEKKWDVIEAHCREDVIVTKRLLDRCKLCGVL